MDQHENQGQAERHQATVVVPANKMDEFNKALEGLNKKAAKFGLSPIKTGAPEAVAYRMRFDIHEGAGGDGEVHTKTLTRITKGMRLKPDEQIVRLYHIPLEYPIVKLGDWQVIAQLEAVHGGNLAFNISNDAQDLAASDEARGHPITCEHCNTKRQRKLGYILKNETGEYKEIGSTCLEDFTGIDPSAALFLAKMYDVIHVKYGDDPEAYSGKCSPTSVGTTQYLSDVLFISERGGFVSASKARDLGISATYDDALNISRLLRDQPKTTKEYWDGMPAREELAESIRQWYSNKETSDSFEKNVKLLLASDDILIDRKHLAFAAAAIPSYHRHLSAERQRAAEALKPLTHVGTVGKKSSMALTVEAVIAFDTMYGRSWRINMTDVDGNKLTWKTSSPSDELLKGKGGIIMADFKVKAHSEYNEKPQTEVTHLKFKEWLKHPPGWKPAGLHFGTVSCQQDNVAVAKSIAADGLEQLQQNGDRVVLACALDSTQLQQLQELGADFQVDAHWRENGAEWDDRPLAQFNNDELACEKAFMQWLAATSTTTTTPQHIVERTEQLRIEEQSRIEQQTANPERPAAAGELSI